MLFIAGFGRSGSTILARVLAGSRSAVSVGELSLLWERAVRLDELCGCGERFSMCVFWNAVGDRAFGGWGNLDLDEIRSWARTSARHRNNWNVSSSRLRRHVQDAGRQYAELYARLYVAIAEVADGGVVVDSSKDPILAALVLRYTNVDLRILHLVRDVRGVAFSLSKKIERPEAVGGSEKEMARLSPVRAGIYWWTYNSAADRLKKRSGHYALTRYENWASAPSETTASALKELDLPQLADSATISDRLELGLDHSVSGNPVRFGSGLTSIKSDQTWRRSMPRRSRFVLTALFGWKLLRYGYPVWRDPS